MEMRHKRHEESVELMEHRKGRHGRGRGGAQTFRRGRAVEFYKSLQIKEQTLIQQIEAKEFESIQAMIAGELKAVQAIKTEFKETFGIEDEELVAQLNTENEEISDKQS